MQGEQAWPTDCHLRLHRPEAGQDGAAGEDAAQITLVQFYRQYVEPDCLLPDAAPTNIRQYRESLRFWALYTGDLPLRAIDQTTCRIFLTEMAKRSGRGRNKTISPNTIRKHCRHLQRCLDLAGPPGRENRLGQDLYGELEIPDGNGSPTGRTKQKPIPYLKPPPRRRKPAVDFFALEELDRWVAVFPQATRPYLAGVTAGRWWLSLITVLYNTAMRIGTGLNLRWSWIQESWLIVPAQGTKGADDRRYWINPPAREALEAMRAANGNGDGDGLIFAWPHCRRYLDTVRVELLSLAQIDPTGHGFHALKKSLTSYLMGIDSGIAQMVAQHSDLKTTVQSYTDPELARMVEVMAKVPQPDPSRVDSQQRLF